MKRMSLITVLALAVAVASAQEARQGAVQDAKAAEVVKKLELEWMESYVKRDTDFLERYLQDASGEFRFTDVWVKRGDRWQAVASQLTRIAKP